MIVDRTPKPCNHKRANHQHGYYQTYVTDRCRCFPCAVAYSEYAEWLADRKAAGRPNLVSDEPSRQHVARLRSDGWPIEELAQRTGVSRWTIERLIHGSPRLIQVSNEKRILAFRGSSGDRTYVIDGVGSRRRIEALVAIGWPLTELRSMAGLGDHTLNRLLLKPNGQCRVSTRDAIKRLYDKLWDHPPPYSQATSRMVNEARRRGYAPPMAWDDDEIDDPAASPRLDAGIDKTRRDLYDQGASDSEIGRRVGVSGDAIRAWRQRNGLPSNYAPRGRTA